MGCLSGETAAPKVQRHHYIDIPLRDMLQTTYEQVVVIDGAAVGAWAESTAR